MSSIKHMPTTIYINYAKSGEMDTHKVKSKFNSSDLNGKTSLYTLGGIRAKFSNHSSVEMFPYNSIGKELTLNGYDGNSNAGRAVRRALAKVIKNNENMTASNIIYAIKNTKDGLLISLVDLKIENRIHKMELVLMIVTSANGRTKTQVFEEKNISRFFKPSQEGKTSMVHKMDPDAVENRGGARKISEDKKPTKETTLVKTNEVVVEVIDVINDHADSIDAQNVIINNQQDEINHLRAKQEEIEHMLKKLLKLKEVTDFQIDDIEHSIFCQHEDFEMGLAQ